MYTPLVPDRFEEGRGSHAAADAQRDEAIARAAPLHLVQQRRRQPRPAAAERMAERDRAAIHVQPRATDRQLTEAGEHLDGERLVQLDQVDPIEWDRQPL